MDSRSLFASRIPEDLSPPSFELQSLCSLLFQPTLTNIFWMGRDSSRGEQALGCPCYTNRNNVAKALRVWGFPGPCVTRGAKLGSCEQESARIIHGKEKPGSSWGVCPAGSKAGNREPAESKKASPSDWFKFKEQPFDQRKWGCRTGGWRGQGEDARQEGRWKTHPPKLHFLSSLTRQLFHGIHKIHLSREAPGGNRGEREEERERERGTERCEGHRGAKVQQHKKINSKRQDTHSALRAQTMQ